jgi:hypothetical protein
VLVRQNMLEKIEVAQKNEKEKRKKFVWAFI